MNETYHDKNLNWENHPMDKKNKTPNSIEEALGTRMQEEPVPEQTQDEILMQALGDVGAEMSVTGDYPETPMMETPPTTKPEIPLSSSENNTIIVNPKTELQIHVSNIEPQPVILNSSQASVELPQEGKPELPGTYNPTDWPAEELEIVASDLEPSAEEYELIRFLEYINGDSYSLSTVGYQLAVICANPQMIPPANRWDLRGDFDLPMLVHDILTTPGYIEQIWPVLKVLMGTSVGNVAWTANVAITLAMFDAVKILPVIKLAERMKEL